MSSGNDTVLPDDPIAQAASPVNQKWARDVKRIVRHALKAGPAREYEEEDGGWWAWAEGYAGGIPVRVTAMTAAMRVQGVPVTPTAPGELTVRIDITAAYELVK